MSTVALSVVLAVTNEGAVRDGSLRGALGALEQSVSAVSGGLSCEVVVVLPAGATVPPPDTGLRVHTLYVHAELAALTPVMWGTGLRAATGRVVAFTTAQLRVAPAWATALMEALNPSVDAGVVGAGGPIALRDAAGSSIPDAEDDAAILARFHAYLPGRWPRVAPAADIPGDNAAYLRARLLEYEDLLRDGFWEVEFHRRFARTGKQLLMVPAAFATVQGPMPGRAGFRALTEQRYAHGVAFGIARVARHGHSMLRIVLAAPVVPFVLLVRIARSARAAGVDAARVRRALPAMLRLTAAWARGEAVGARRAARPGNQVTFAHD